MTDLNDYPWKSASAKMSITDVMWSYTIDIDGDASDITPFEILEYLHPTTLYPLIRCLPVSHKIDEDYPDKTTTIEGYSLALYLSNPIPLCERQSKITLYDEDAEDDEGNSLTGDIESYENPITYALRIWDLLDTGMEAVFQEIPEPPEEEEEEEEDDTQYALKKQYTFDAHPVIDLYSQIASDYNRVYFEKIVKTDSGPVHRFYLVNFEDIDTQLGLPETPLVIYASDVQVIGAPGPVTTRDLTDCKNVVWVELCRKKDNAWFFAERRCPAVIAGTEKPRILVYRSTNLLPDPESDVFIDPDTGDEIDDPKTENCGCITVIEGYEDQTGGISYGTAEENTECQAIADAKAEEIVTCLDIDVRQFEISFHILNSAYYELQLYQKIHISGFTDSIPEELLRITEIEYNYTNEGDGGDTVRLILVPDAEIQAARMFEQMQDDVRSNTLALKQSIERNIINNKIGMVKSLSPGRVYANLQLRSSGRMVQTRAWGERVKAS